MNESARQSVESMRIVKGVREQVSCRTVLNLQISPNKVRFFFPRSSFVHVSQRWLAPMSKPVNCVQAGKNHKLEMEHVTATGSALTTAGQGLRAKKVCVKWSPSKFTVYWFQKLSKDFLWTEFKSLSYAMWLIIRSNEFYIIVSLFHSSFGCWPSDHRTRDIEWSVKYLNN